MIERKSLRQTQLFYLAAATLGSLGTAYLLIGLYRLTLSDASPFACDLFLRWTEMKTVISGVAPSVAQTTYPPWAYGWGLLIVPPSMSWSILRLYFAALNIVALFIIAQWAYRTISNSGKALGLLASCSCLSMISISYCLSNGQYSLIVTAALVLMLCCIQKNWQILAGVAASLAFIKPHLAAIFILILLFRRQWWALVSFSFVTLLMTGMASAITATSPIDLLRYMLLESGEFSQQSQGIAGILINVFGLDKMPATFAAMTLGGTIAAVLLWRFRRYRLELLFSIAAVMSMLWSYNKAYDQTIVAFLLVASASGIVIRPDMAGVVPFATLTLLMTFPFRMKDCNSVWLQLCCAAVWLLCMAMALRTSRVAYKTGNRKLSH